MSDLTGITVPSRSLVKDAIVTYTSVPDSPFPIGGPSAPTLPSIPGTTWSASGSGGGGSIVVGQNTQGQQVALFLP